MKSLQRMDGRKGLDSVSDGGDPVVIMPVLDTDHQNVALLPWSRYSFRVKRHALALLPVLTLVMFAVAQNRDISDPKHIHDGTVSQGIYSNDYFGFSIEVPHGWKVADNNRYRKLNRKSRNDAAGRDSELVQLGRGDEVNAPVLVMGEVQPWTEGKNRRLVQILSTDLSDRPERASAEDFLNFTANMNRKKGLDVRYLAEPQSVKIGGRILWKSYFTQRSTTEWHGVNVVTIEKNHVLQFILLSPDANGLQSLELLLNTLRFRS